MGLAVSGVRTEGELGLEHGLALQPSTCGRGGWLWTGVSRGDTGAHLA